MTREDFINWFKERFALTKNDIYELGQLYDEVTKPHWISVEDELPPITQWVLTYNPTYDEYHFDVERYGRGENLVDFGVTHWMPLPQAPKEGGEK